MNSLELLEKYPTAAQVVKSWYMGKMLESFADKNVPDDFKEFMRNQGVDNDKIAKMIDGSPRILFDVFDENDIVIQINTKDRFSYSINNAEATSSSWFSRKEAESEAIKIAFEMLNGKIDSNDL